MNEELRIADIVFESIMQGVIVTDSSSTIISVNPAFTKITGYSREEVIGQKPSILNSGKQNGLFYIDMWTTIHETGHWEGEIWNRRKDGIIYLEHLTIRSIVDHRGVTRYYIGVFSDITERKRHEDLIRYKAYRDFLTGLPNRNLLYDRMTVAIQKSRERKEKFTVLFLDLDRFKVINDSLGHHIGDLLLKTVAKRLNSCTRACDMVARLGGDEFIVLLQDVSNEKNAARAAQKIIDELSQPCILDGHEVFVSTSVGIALSSHDDEDVDGLIQKADAAMYYAKRRGRNNYQFYTSALHAKISERLAFESDLRQALSNGEFVLHYQPQYDVRNEQIVGVEALLRWQHPVRGLLAPAEFMPLAEETGLIVPIGEWVLRTACRQGKWWLRILPSLKIAVNLSARQFEQADFIDIISNVLEETGLPPNNLELELTESLMVLDQNQMMHDLQDLKNLGVCLAIDDFGTGYSSYSYLRKLPFDILKLDRSYVKELTLNECNAEIVLGIITMAHRLNLQVVAEGVEIKEQLDFLRKCACDYVQGFLFSKALPALEFEKELLTFCVPSL